MQSILVKKEGLNYENFTSLPIEHGKLLIS